MLLILISHHVPLFHFSLSTSFPLFSFVSSVFDHRQGLPPSTSTIFNATDHSPRLLSLSSPFPMSLFAYSVIHRVTGRPPRACHTLTHWSRLHIHIHIHTRHRQTSVSSDCPLPPSSQARERDLYCRRHRHPSYAQVCLQGLVFRCG